MRHHHPIPARMLGLIQGLVGALQSGLRRFNPLRPSRDTNTDRDFAGL